MKAALATQDITRIFLGPRRKKYAMNAASRVWKPNVTAVAERDGRRFAPDSIKQFT